MTQCPWASPNVMQIARDYETLNASTYTTPACELPVRTMRSVPAAGISSFARSTCTALVIPFAAPFQDRPENMGAVKKRLEVCFKRMKMTR